MEAGVKCDGMCIDCNFHTFTKQLLCAVKLRKSAIVFSIISDDHSLGLCQQRFMPE